MEKPATIRLLRQEPAFSELFMMHLLSRNVRIEEDLVDQLFKFRKLGFINYNGGLHVHSSLLNVVLLDQRAAQSRTTSHRFQGGVPALGN